MSIWEGDGLRKDVGMGVDGPRSSTTLSCWSCNGKAGPVAPGSLIAGQNPEAGYLVQALHQGLEWTPRQGLQS